MSNNPSLPITFTSEEQVALGELQERSRIFNNIILLLENNHFVGKDALALLEGINAIKSLLEGVKREAASIDDQARLRSSSPKKVFKQESK